VVGSHWEGILKLIRWWEGSMSTIKLNKGFRLYF
jgi:hypothetical protein